MTRSARTLVALALLAGLGALSAFALGATTDESESSKTQAASKAPVEVRTEVVRRTIRIVRREHRRHPRHHSSPAASAPPPPSSSSAGSSGSSSASSSGATAAAAAAPASCPTPAS